MTFFNNWITHNLHERFVDPNVDYKIYLHPYKFKEMEFHEAADFAANLIAQKYSNIFLSFSGGADSDYVFHCFKRNNIDFTPIIVQNSGNSIEMSYALHTCRKFNVEPIILKINDIKYLKLFEEVVEKINGVGIQAISGIFACRYAKEHDGILITGEHLINDFNSDNSKLILVPGTPEGDFYNEIFVGDEYNLPFFNYTAELTWAMINKIEQIPIDEWKWQVYELDYRPKICNEYSYHFNQVYLKIRNKKRRPNSNFIFESKEQFLSILEPFKKNT